MPRINLAKAMAKAPTNPPAGTPVDTPIATLTVTFNYQTGAVTLPANADVSVNKKGAKIAFDLSCSPALPAGKTASIEGLEFSKPTEPTGTFAPSAVFSPSHSINVSGAAHTVYGNWKANKHELKVTDDDNATAASGQKDYGYKVWINYNNTYYSSPDPKISNTQPPPSS